ncbi:MAG: prepilin-type N-terminal cleavage/methylation domain-containing protein [Elusimicrobia bacterium]|nr:prepilin-type N-terminal cleavage/methylation domain-containing protein [Elusimicrobiota bacterium]
MTENRKKSFTLVEMLITVVILGIVFIPLVKIMVSSLRTWWMSKSKMTIQEDGRETLAYIVNEFKGSFKYSLGSLISNGGFESATYDQVTGVETPSWWQMPSGDDTVYILSASTDYVSSGVYSIRLHAPGTYAYNGSGNDGFSTTADIKNLVFSFKAKAYPGAGPTDITGEIRQDGVATALLSTGTAGAVTLSSSTWRRFTAVEPTFPSGENYRVRFNSTNGDVLIDEVSVVPETSILVSPTESANVSGYKYETQVTGGMTSVKETEIRIEQRTSSSGNTINRLCLYRIDSSGGTNPVYVARFYNALAENVKELKFILDSPEVATKGPDVPVTIELKLGIEVKFTGHPTYFTLRTTIFPRN